MIREREKNKMISYMSILSKNKILPTFVATIIILMFVSSGYIYAATGNLLLNPGFETNDGSGGGSADNWTQSNMGVESWAWHTGSWGMTINTWGSATSGYSYQIVDAAEDVAYTFSIYAARDDGTQTGDYYLKFEYYNSSDAHITGEDYTVNKTLTTSWVLQSITDTAPANTAKIRVIFGGDDVLRVGKFDDASLTADTFVWDGSSSTVWGTAANWVSGVTPAAPGSGDNAAIPSVSNQPVLGSAVTVTNLTIHSGATVSLNGENLTVSGTYSNLGTLQLNGDETTVSLTNDSDSGLTKFVKSTGTITIKNLSPYYSLEFDSNSAGDGDAVFTLPAAIVVNNNLTIADGTLDASGSNYAITAAGNWSNSSNEATGFNARSGTVTFNGTAAQTVTTGGDSFYALVVTNATDYVTFNDATSCTNFTAQTASSKMKFRESVDFTVTGILTLDGQAGSTEVELISASDGTAWNFVAPETTVDYVKVKDSNSTNTITANHSISLGNNTNWVFAGTTRYWVAAADSDWNTDANWSATSGGAGGASYPATGGTAIFDSASDYNCTLGAAVSVAVLDVQTGYDDTISCGANNFTAAGNMTITSGTFTVGANTTQVDGTLTVSGGIGTFTSGTLDCNSAVIVSSGTLTAPSGSFDVAGNWEVSGTGTFTPGTGTTTLSGSSKTIITSSSSDDDFYNLTVSGSYTLEDPLTLSHDLLVSGTLDVKEGENNKLTVGRNINTENGTFTARSGTFEWTSPDYSGSILVGTSHFYDFIKSGPYQLKIASYSDEPLMVDGTFTLSAGTFLVDYPGFTVTGATSITGGTLTCYKNATFTGAVTNASTMELHGQYESVDVTIGASINNTGGAITITDATNSVNLIGSAGALRPLTGNNIDFNSHNINLNNIDIQIATTLDEAGDQITLTGDCTFDAITLNGDATTSFTTGAYTATVGGTFTNTFGTVTISDGGEINATGYNVSTAANGIITLAGASSLKAVNITNAGTINLDHASNEINITGNMDNDNIIDATGVATNIYLEGNWDNSATFTSGSSTVTFDGTTDDCTIDTGASTFNNVTISKTDSTDTVTVQNDALDIDGDLTVVEGELVLQTNSSFGDNGADTVAIQAGGTLTSTTAGITVTFFAGSTTTLVDDSTAKFIFTGGVGSLINLHSSSAGTQWNITRGNNAYTIGTDYIDVKDSNATSGATMSAGTNSNNTSNNDNWVFDGTKIWIGGGTDTDFTTADNWQDNIAPATDDNILFNYGSNDCDLDHFDMGDGDFEMTSGYSGTVSWVSDPGQFEADKVTLDLTNATWSIADEFWTGVGNDVGALTITAGTFTTSDVLRIYGNITLSGNATLNQTGQYTLMDGTAAKTISNSGSGSITFCQVGEISDTSANANASTTISCDVATILNVEVNDWDAAGDGKLILTGGKTLNIGGDFINKGSFTSNNASNVVQVAGDIRLNDPNTWGFSDSGTFEWDGIADKELFANSDSSLNHFHDFKISGSAQLKMEWENAGTTVDGNFSQTGGTFWIDNNTGFTVDGTTTISSGTFKVGKNATLTGDVTNSGIVELCGNAALDLKVGSGNTLSNNGTVQVTDITNPITLTGDGGQFTFTGTDIDYNAKSIIFKNIDYDPDVTLATGETIVIGDANCEFDSITINSGGTLDDSGNYNFNVSGNWSNSGTFTQGTSTVTLNGTNQSISGTTTFYGLSKEVTTAYTLTFEESKTQTVSDSLTLKGASGNLLSIRSSLDDTRAALTLDDGSQDLDYLDVKDNDASDGDTLAAGPNSTDSLNNLNWTFKIISVTLRNAGDSADYTTWAIGSGKIVDTVYLMDTGNCVLVKNDGNVAEDFSLEANGTNWTLGSSTAENQCVLMGLFNADTAPTSGDYSTTYDLVDGDATWATQNSGTGYYEGASDGDNITVGSGEKLYIYLKTPSSITSGNQETITVTVGSREH